jgi:hypothetical protein
MAVLYLIGPEEQQGDIKHMAIAAKHALLGASTPPTDGTHTPTDADADGGRQSHAHAHAAGAGAVNQMEV